MAARAQQNKKRTPKSSADRTVKTTKPRSKASATKPPAKTAAASKSASVGKGASKKRATARNSAMPDQVARLEAELAAARKRIAELESMHDDAVNRIDWVIDSLQTLIADQSKD